MTCGVGRATRQVVCSNYHHPVDQSFCDNDDKPATEQECTAGPCPSVYNRQRIYEQPYGYPQDPGHHPGHSSWNVPSADNQWRTGPWGAVCSSYNTLFEKQQRSEVLSHKSVFALFYIITNIQKPLIFRRCAIGPVHALCVFQKEHVCLEGNNIYFGNTRCFHFSAQNPYMVLDEHMHSILSDKLGKTECYLFVKTFCWHKVKPTFPAELRTNANGEAAKATHWPENHLSSYDILHII